MSNARSRILDALEEVLTEHGATGATLEVVAERAGVSKGGLLYHFRTKEAMFGGLLERLGELSQQEVETGVADPENAVALYLQSSTDSDDAYTRTLVASLRLLGAPGVEAEEAIAASLDVWFGALRQLVDDPLLAHLILLVGDGLYLRALCGQTPGADELRVIDHLVAEARRSG